MGAAGKHDDEADGNENQAGDHQEFTRFTHRKILSQPRYHGASGTSKQPAGRAHGQG
jgi:hypothetical protein